MRAMNIAAPRIGGQNLRAVPVTATMIGLIAIGFLLELFRAIPPNGLSLETAAVSSEPWTLVTYFMSSSRNPIATLFGLYWIWSIGPSVEFHLNCRRFAIGSFLLIFLSGVFGLLGAIASKEPGFMSGMWVWLSAVTIFWAARIPNLEVKLFMAIPVKAKVVAALSILTVMFTAPAPIAIASALPLIVVGLIATNRLPDSFARKSKPKQQNTIRNVGNVGDKYFDEVRNRERQREEKERLRKLFEASMIDNEPDENRKLD